MELECRCLSQLRMCRMLVQCDVTIRISGAAVSVGLPVPIVGTGCPVSRE